jgi:hypothetical protein
MTRPADSDTGDGHHRARGPFGPLETLDDAQRQAFDAAMRVAGELTTLGGDLAGGAWFGAAPTSAPSNGAAPADDDPRRVDVGKLRSDVIRAAETFSELMRALLDVGFDAMNEIARRPARRPSATALPGGVARVSCAVHNDKREPIRQLHARLQQLVSGDGTALHADFTVSPEELDLEPYERSDVEIAIEIPGDTRPGRYHGLVLVAGLPDVAHAITVEVTDPATSADDD